ncbi:MAG: hypothetical protein M3680_11505 [Myxococcota bacterium]|nr:hypothetical protein [Myxococcota bacterium]
MSPLAFDKQGKPFAWHSRTRKLKVRLFRNPAARGTCCQVLDGAGAPLYVDAETDYPEFRRAIGNVPGFYRLDQCDDDCVEIEGAAPAYVSIEHLRNAQPADGGASSNDVNPLVIIQSMAAIQADVMKTMAAQQAALMAATAEIMRAPYRPAPPAPADHRNAYDEDDDDELEDEEEVTASNEILGMLGPLLPKIGEKFGEQLGQKVIEAVLGVFGRKPDAQTAAPAATPAPMPVSHPAPAPTAPHVHGSVFGVAAGQGSMPVQLHVQVAAGDDVAMFEATDHDGNAGEAATPGMFAPTASAAMSGFTAQWPAATLVPDAPNSEPAIPTPEQMAHLLAIRESLTPTERTLSERVIARMAPDIQAQWLGALATKSIEDAATEIRAVLAQLQNSKQR